MSNDSSAINELVTKHAEENKEKGDTGDQSQSSQQQNNNAGGGGKEPTEAEKEAAAKLEQENTAKLAEVEKVKGEAQKELLKKFGVETVEELEEKFSKKEVKVLTKEEKDKEDDLYEAKLRAFAVEKGEMKGEDFDQLKTLKSRKDAELIFDGYLKDWKEENPDMKVSDDLTEADILEAAKKDFEKEYKLNSDKESVKNKGIARLAREAAEIRNPLESSYNDVKEQFNNANEIRENFPKFVKGLQGIANEVVPEKIEWYKGKDGDEDLPPIEIPLSEDDRKEILDKVAKRLEKPENYLLFKEGKLADLKESISEYADYLVSKKTKEIGNNKIAEYFLNRGKDKGSNVGAANSFATNQAKTGQEQQKQKSSKAEVEQEVLKQFGKK